MERSDLTRTRLDGPDGPDRSRRILRRGLLKRTFDILVSASLLVLLSPLILGLSVGVRLRLGRPIIYRQRRPGLHGKPFTMYKFRSMHDLTDEHGVLIDELERTPPFGRRLRSLSLDELPELWNVLRGDMSLVGPRPLLMEYLPRYTAEQMRRHEVRPGITGLAQVSGRNALTWEEKFALDIEYVDNHDLRIDLAIMVETVRVVATKEGVRHAGEDEVDMPEFLGTATRQGQQSEDL